MTASTTGRPRSAPSSVKRGDPAGQLGQRIDPQRRHPARGRVILPDHRPRAALDQRRPQPGLRGGHDVVIQPVTHIQDPARPAWGRLDHLLEEARIGLGDAPVIRGGDHVGGQPEIAQKAARAGRLIPRNTDPQARIPEPSQRRPGIWIEIVLAEPFGPALIGPLLPGLVQVEPRLEDLEGLPVILAARDHRAEDCREHMPRDAQPVRPGPVLPGLIHQDLADIEDHRADHASHPTTAHSAPRSRRLGQNP